MASMTDATLYDGNFEAWLAGYRGGLTGHVSEDWALQRAQTNQRVFAGRTAEVSMFERPAAPSPARTTRVREAA